MKLPFARSEGDAWFTIEDEVQKVLGVPVAGQVPLIEEEGLRLIHNLSTFSPLMEAFRWVRANLDFLTLDNPVRSLVVTSAMPNEGKSTLALNLAMTYCLNNKDVVVVGGDLRRPTLHKLLQCDSQPGLTDVICGQATLSEITLPTRVCNLSFIPSGTIPPNPTELLGSNNMKQIIEALEQRFEVVLYDSAPVLPVADAMVLAAQVGNVLLVTGPKAESLADAKRALSFLTRTRTNVVGVAVNRSGNRGGCYYSRYYRPTGKREIRPEE